MKRQFLIECRHQSLEGRARKAKTELCNEKEIPRRMELLEAEEVDDGKE